MQLGIANIPHTHRSGLERSSTDGIVVSELDGHGVHSDDGDFLSVYTIGAVVLDHEFILRAGGQAHQEE